MMLTQAVKFALLCTGVVLAGGCSSTGQDSNANAPATTPTEMRTSAQPDEDSLPDGVLPLPQPSGGDDFAVLPAGRYQVPISDTLAYEIELPEGTYAYDGKYLAFDQARPQRIAGILYVDEAGEGVGVSRDPCTKQDDIVPAGRTIDELVSAISNQPILDVSEPVTAELGGARGLYLEVRIPKDYNASRCGGGEIGLVGRSGMIRNALPGYVGTWWVLNVDGERILVQPYCPGPCPDNSTEHLKEVAETITFTKLG
jgi:hypothetical protein